MTASQAAETALILPDYEGHRVVWTKVGCEYLGLYTDMPLHLETPNPRPAYLVQTLGDPVPGHPSANIAVNFIDATSGEHQRLRRARKTTRDLGHDVWGAALISVAPVRCGRGDDTGPG